MYRAERAALPAAAQAASRRTAAAQAGSDGGTAAHSTAPSGELPAGTPYTAATDHAGADAAGESDRGGAPPMARRCPTPWHSRRLSVQRRRRTETSVSYPPIQAVERKRVVKRRPDRRARCRMGAALCSSRPCARTARTRTAFSGAAADGGDAAGQMEWTALARC